MKDFYEFTYKLSYEEIYEAFLQLNQKRNKKIRIFTGVALTGIAFAMLVGFYLDGQKIHYFILAIFAILLLYYLIYVPVLKARNGAKKVRKINGTYRVHLTKNGKIKAGNETIDLSGDKDARAIETDNIFVLRPDNSHTFCLPKRIMKQEEISGVRELLKGYVKYLIR